MKREHQLQRRLRSLTALADAVGAMKSLSAHHFREARATVDAAHVYRAGVERILARVGASLVGGDGAAGLLVVGAELGLCRGYNAQVVAAATAQRTTLGAGPTLCIGHRAASLLARRGVAAVRTYAAPTGVRGITDLLSKVAEDLLTTFVSERLATFDIVSSRFGGVGTSQPTVVRLLPLAQPAATDGAASRYASRTRVASAVVREFLYVTLYDVLLDALAAEHGARIVATQSAEEWLDQRRRDLRRRLTSARRETSTQEMLEIVAGARARAATHRRRL
ncbi:MAG: FoF1 ATP synthase subunit gamma [Planctomycetota bacterium]